MRDLGSPRPPPIEIGSDRPQRHDGEHRRITDATSPIDIDEDLEEIDLGEIARPIDEIGFERNPRKSHSTRVLRVVAPVSVREKPIFSAVCQTRAKSRCSGGEPHQRVS